jgi:glycosyltransferase involved in cell wall biosynthesis
MIDMTPNLSGDATLRVFFIIRSLELGGAERQLLALAGGLAARGHAVAIGVMYPGGLLESRVAANVTLVPLAKRGRWDTLGFAWRLVTAARRFRPTVVHGYMMGANEAALLVGRLLRCPVVWGIRVSTQPGGRYSPFRDRLFRLSCRLSHWADACIANSEAGRSYHVARGYPGDRCLVIPNGIDTRRFTPDPQRGRAWRVRHEIPLDAPVILLPARLDPMKDHATFLAAAARLIEHRPDVRLVAMGRGSEDAVTAFKAATASAGLAEQVRYLPEEDAVESAYCGATLGTLTSAFGEGFPNVLAEAMASGIPCVATDCGDSRLVIGDSGLVVPIGDAHQLADAWLNLLTRPLEDRVAMGLAARRRIADHFGVDPMVTTTCQALQAVRQLRARS